MCGWARSTCTARGRSTRCRPASGRRRGPSSTPDGADYTLVSCTVGPGFDFNDFSFMQPDGDEAALLRHHWPELAALI